MLIAPRVPEVKCLPVLSCGDCNQLNVSTAVSAKGRVMQAAETLKMADLVDTCASALAHLPTYSPGCLCE